MKYTVTVFRHSDNFHTTHELKSEAEMYNRLQFEVNRMKEELPIGETAEIWVNCYKFCNNPYADDGYGWVILKHYNYLDDGSMKKEEFKDGKLFF